MSWYLNRALTTMRAEVNARWPGRDRSSDGTIGDAAHQASVSDHNPDADGSVDAWDMDVNGVDVWAVIAAFEKHPAALYWIYDGQIADRRYGWRREPYSGSNPHTGHVHFNTRESYEDSAQTWGIEEDGGDVSFQEKLDETSSTKARFGPGDKTAETYVKLGAIYAYDAAKTAGAAVAAVTALREVVDQLGEVIRAGGGSVDTAAILSGVDARLTALRQELPEATADAVVAEIAS